MARATPMQMDQRRALASGARDQLVAMCVLELRRGFIESVKACGAAVNGQLQAMAKEFGRPDRAAFLRIHQRVGEMAQDSVLRSYDQLVTAREGPASRTHYRVGAGRYAGGVLRRALAQKDLFEATSDGLRWVNMPMLDREARQWHRVNFGARGAGSGSVAEYEVTYQNLVVGVFGYGEGPSPGFALPAGFWMGPEGERVTRGASARGADRFYPASQRPAGFRGPPGARRQTAGIEAKNFLDAGLRTIAREFPRGYEQLYSDIASRIPSRRQVRVLPVRVSRFTV